MMNLKQDVFIGNMRNYLRVLLMDKEDITTDDACSLASVGDMKSLCSSSPESILGTAKKRLTCFTVRYYERKNSKDRLRGLIEFSRKEDKVRVAVSEVSRDGRENLDILILIYARAPDELIVDFESRVIVDISRNIIREIYQKFEG